MPIFEYICKDCKKRFEILVYGAQQPQCPLCRSTNLDQQLSVFAVRAASASAAAACSSAAECPAASPACCGGRCDMA
jgi:putative FmdB family regulatory protein